MKVSALIAELQELQKQAGDLDVTASGFYGSWSDELEVGVTTHPGYFGREEGGKVINIRTDICTG